MKKKKKLLKNYFDDSYYYEQVKKLVDEAPDSKLIDDRKCVLINGMHFSLLGEVLIYQKARIDMVEYGTPAIVHGFTVYSTVTKPGTFDGFVIAIPN